MADSFFTHPTEQRKLNQDRVRERNQRHKWAFGEAAPSRGHPSRRPVKPLSFLQTGYIRHEVEFQQNKAARAAQTAHSSRKYNTTANPDAALSDSSAEEDMGEASAAPEPDAGYTYSFDAATGPSKGNEILSQALIKAVKQFETKQTEKLVKEEYEVIAGFKEEGHPLYAAVEDDFELL